MSVDAAAGYPQYADTDIGYIPQLYAPATLVKYYAMSTIPAITNTKYEGVISDFGDKVIIRTRPSITTRRYKKGQDLVTETPESPPVQLNIDQAMYYDFVIDVVDEKQADIVLSTEFTEDAAEQMKVSIDTDELGVWYASAHASNQGATAGAKSAGWDLGVTGSGVVVTKSNVVEVITMLGAVLDEQNVPEAGRWLVVPPWFRWLLMNSDLKNASVTGDDSSVVRRGRVGEIDRFTLYMSTLLADTTDGSNTVTNIMAGQKDAITFAAQLVKNESLPAPKNFGREYRGLQVWGSKVVKPEALVWLYAYKG